ncbi:MAG: anti-sigma factor family protein [Blastopirellula sp. JB062]
MDTRRALELIDAHLDGERLTEEDAAALTQWLKADERQADEAFRRIFLHSYLRQQMQTIALMPADDRAAIEPPALDGPMTQPQGRFFKNGIIGAIAALTTILAGVTLLAFYFAPGNDRADPFVYEGFDYAPHATPRSDVEWPTIGGLSGLNGGVGFAAPWSESGQLVSLIEADPAEHPWEPTDMRQLGPLGYSDRLGLILKSGGNQLRTSAGPNSITSRPLDISAAPLKMRDADAIGADGCSLWISFLAQSFDSSGGGRYAYVQLGDQQGGLRIGKLQTSPSGNWSAAAVKDDAEINLKSSDKPSGESVLIVARIDFRPGAEQAFVWINPDLGRPPIDAQSTLRLPTPDFRIDQILIAGRYSTDFDEIRLGATFRDVAPIASP